MLTKEKFCSSFTHKKISDKEYDRVVKVCFRSEIKTMKYYHGLYLLCDVLLLADVFQKFRNSSLKNYGLYPSHYLGAPALSWEAMLSVTKVELELISDANMYLFFKKDTRGEVSYIYKRYS